MTCELEMRTATPSAASPCFHSDQQSHHIIPSCTHAPILVALQEIWTQRLRARVIIWFFFKFAFSNNLYKKFFPDSSLGYKFTNRHPFQITTTRFDQPNTLQVLYPSPVSSWQPFKLSSPSVKAFFGPPCFFLWTNRFNIGYHCINY
jgi:hypothetical protein